MIHCERSQKLPPWCRCPVWFFCNSREVWSSIDQPNQTQHKLRISYSLWLNHPQGTLQKKSASRYHQLKVEAWLVGMTSIIVAWQWVSEHRGRLEIRWQISVAWRGWPTRKLRCHQCTLHLVLQLPIRLCLALLLCTRQDLEGNNDRGTN